MGSFEELETCYQKYWNNEEQYVAMPNALRGKLYLDKIVKDIKIVAILDNNRELDNTYYNGIPICYAPNYLEKNKKCKILISNYYEDIAEQLEQLGYRENIDYMEMHKFVSLWYWEHRREVHIWDIHIAITTYCTLNCQKCNMFINCYQPEQRRHIALEEFQENVTNFFKNVDYCYKFSILGGEPLLNMQLANMLKWLGENYGKVIGKIEIVTNGTVLPWMSLLQVCKEQNVRFIISDYGQHINLAENLETFVNILQGAEIEYSRRQDKIWKNFYFPKEKQGVKMTSVREHMLNCNPIFRGLNDNQFYYCHIVWSAVQAGLLSQKQDDAISLKEEMNEEQRYTLLAYDLGFIKSGYISLCQYCGGCGRDNVELIPAGIQEERKRKY